MARPNMSDNDDQNDDGIYRADTVPPPDGGDDAYNAPTRVGPMAATVVNEMLVAAQAAQAAQSGDRVPTSKVKPRDGVDGGELDDRDIEAELDPTAFPPPPRLPTSGRTSRPPSLRAPPTPVFSSRPAPPPASNSFPKGSVGPSSASTASVAPVVPPAPISAPFQPQPHPASTASSTRLPLIIIACAGVAAVLMALAYGVVVTLGGH